MSVVQSHRSYRSPVNKLLRFFEGSRNQWRDKCKGAKQHLKMAKLRVQRLEEQRNRWRDRARELEARVLELESRSTLGTRDRFFREGN